MSWEIPRRGKNFENCQNCSKENKVYSGFTLKNKRKKKIYFPLQVAVTHSFIKVENVKKQFAIEFMLLFKVELKEHGCKEKLFLAC